MKNGPPHSAVTASSCARGFANLSDSGSSLVSSSANGEGWKGLTAMSSRGHPRFGLPWRPPRSRKRWRRCERLAPVSDAPGTAGGPPAVPDVCEDWFASGAPAGASSPRSAAGVADSGRAARGPRRGLGQPLLTGEEPDGRHWLRLTAATTRVSAELDRASGSPSPDTNLTHPGGYVTPPPIGAFLHVFSVR